MPETRQKNDMTHTTDYGNGIIAIDSGYHRPDFDAIHLVIAGNRAALIDTATNAAAPRVMSALQHYGIPPEQVEAIILTHIHLDHAGGAGLLMSQFPNARLYVHPLGARHIANPEKLLAGTAAVYGEEQTRTLYGTLLPVESARIVAVEHGQTLSLGGRELLMLHTPGHARHHICIRDGQTGHFFTGDTFGISYRELDHDGRNFICPTSTPVHFDPDALHRSIDLLMSYQPRAMYLTHYGKIQDIPRLAADLHRLIDQLTDLARPLARAGEQRHELLKKAIGQMLVTEARREHWGTQDEDLLTLLAMDIDLNAQGLAVWLDTQIPH